jgi:putative membrane protein
VYIKGIAMGAADVVPGVSGGTIAFITGIYERLIQAIKNINLKNIELFFKGKFKECWTNIDGMFLLCLLLGIVTSLFTLAHLMTYLLDNHPIQIWSFFFGLILASTLFIGRDVKWNWNTALAFVFFAIAAFFITDPSNTPINSDNAYWYLFLCGAIAICAMILPGISGSFILVLLGQYYFLLDAVKSFNIAVIFVFAAGALVGILSFANVLSWLFKHFKMITLAALTGFMLGSLNKIWPWKKEIFSFNEYGEMIDKAQINISPMQFETITASNNHLWEAVLLMIIGFVLIFVVEYISIKLKKKIN